MWTQHRQQQQRGVQFKSRGTETSAEAVKDRKQADVNRQKREAEFDELPLPEGK